MFNAFETYKAGMIFHNSNGEDYLILKVNKEKDRWLLAKLNSEYFVVAWGLQEHSC